MTDDPMTPADTNGESVPERAETCPRCKSPERNHRRNVSCDPIGDGLCGHSWHDPAPTPQATLTTPQEPAEALGEDVALVRAIVTEDLHGRRITGERALNRILSAAERRTGEVARLVEERLAFASIAEHFEEGSPAKFIDCPMCRESCHRITAALAALTEDTDSEEGSGE